MVDSTKFSPADLDQVEDALESLGTAPVPTDLPDHVATRLGEYQSILELSRKALPMEEVRPGLLKGVLAEARGEIGSEATQENGVSVPRQPSGGNEHSPSPSLWTRVRRILVLPGLALAGSAAIVLWMVRPKDEGESASRLRPEVIAIASETPSPTPSDRGRSEAEPAAPTEVRPPSPEAEVAEERLGAQRAVGRRASLPKASRKKKRDARPASVSSRGQDKGGSAGLGPDDAITEQAPGNDRKLRPGSITWNQIARADSKRRAGKCGAARLVYRDAIEALDKQIAARGHAGLGLCAEQQGGDGANAFGRAHQLDPLIDGFVADEQRRFAEQKASSPRTSAKPDPAPTDADGVGETN